MKTRCVASDIDLRQPARSGNNLLFACFTHPALRRQQIRVLGQGTADQAFQFGIVELLPPFGKIGAFRDRQTERGFSLTGGTIAIRHRRIGLFIVGTHGAAGGEQGEKKRAFHAAAPPPPRRSGFFSSNTSGSTANTIHIRTWNTSI